ncbi:hypothetical protein CAEBREN_07852 [Caenorhabditis brenneri]|uniref:Nucleotide-diphospho-sugar transferase domain-containing protein n=1 Tax=Caenorhabditis brenneri TaxID=135651 RepID=G0MZ80_CAEBE|nr:hypothetical protein CAEBREN_07852 [Caenorhabditis brenneri]
MKELRNFISTVFDLIFFNRISLISFYSFWFLVGILALRKSQNALSAVQYVKSNSDSVSLDSIESSPEFERLIKVLDEKYPRPPAFFLLNQYALNMTDNFLCNTATLEGAHERFVFVTLDEVARDKISKRWPEIQIFHWPTPSLYKPFSFAEGAYQTIYLLRSNLALALIKNVTYSWEWMFSDQSNPPYLLQLDCETNGGTKLMQLGRYGFHFVNPDGTCNNEKIFSAKSRMENGTVEVQMTKTLPSWGRLQFKLYWYITEYLLWIPVFGEYLRPYLALAGFILMITI